MVVCPVRFGQGVDRTPGRPGALLTPGERSALDRQGYELPQGEPEKRGEILVSPALPLPKVGQGVPDLLRILLCRGKRLSVRVDDSLGIGHRERGETHLRQGD